MADEITTVGLGVDTSGIERGIRSLDDLAARGPKVEKSIGGVAQAADRAGSSLDSMGASARGGAGLSDVAVKAGAAASGIESVGRAASTANSGLGASTNSLGLFGRTAAKAAEALDLYASSTKAAEDHQKSLARILDRADPAAAAARTLASEVQTLNRALREGAIGGDTYAKAMRNVFDEANRASDGMTNVGTAASMTTGLIKKAAGAFAAAFSLREFISTADAITSLNNQLKLATGSATSATAAYAALYDIAQRSRVGFVQLGTTYASIARATGEMGISQQKLLTIVESIGNAMTISGGSAAGMQAALVQLGQGFASGTLRGDELNSVLEQTPRLARAIADGLGVSIGQLREMGKQGKLTSEAVVGALASQADVLRNEVSGATLTVGQAFTKLSNASTHAIGEFDRASGVSESFASAISSIADSVDGLGRSFADNKPIIETTMTALTGAAAVGGLLAIPRAIGAIGGAVAALGTMLAANPVVLALLGIGTVAGAAIGYGRAQAKTSDGVLRSIEALKQENERSEQALQRAVEGGREYGADTIRKAIQDRKAQIASLNAELAKLNGESLGVGAPNAVSMESAARANADKVAAAAAAEREKALNRLSGISDDYQKRLSELQDQERRGILTHDEYTQALTKLATQTYNASDAGKAAAESAKKGATASAAQAKQMAELSGLTGTFYADWDRLNAMFKAGKISVDQLTEAQAKLLEKQPAIKAAAQEQAKLQEAANKSADREIDAITKQFDAMAKADEAITKARQSAATSAQQSLQKMQDENEARRMAAAMGISQARAIELINIKRLEEQRTILRGKGGHEKELKALEEEIAARKKLAGEIGVRDADDAAIKAARKAEEEWQKTADQINQSLTDALMRGFESGKDFAKNLRDTVVNMFKTMVLKPVIQMVLSPISLGLSSLMSGGAAMAAQGGIGGGAGTLSTAASGLSLASSAFGAGGMAAFPALLNGGLAGYTSATGALLTSGSMAGTMAGVGMVAAPIAAALGIASALGLFGGTHKRGDTLIGTLGQAGGVHDADLMRRDGSLLSGPNWFVDDKGVSKADKAIQKQWEDSLKTVTQWSEALGLSTDKIKGFTTTLGTEKLGDHGQLGIRLDKDGTPLSDQEIQAKIAEAIRSGNNDLAQEIIGSWTETTEKVKTTIRDLTQWTEDNRGNVTTETDVVKRTYKPSEFARDGEQAIDTLQRLATSLLAANTAFKHIGQTAYEGSLAGADLASQLVDQFGTLDQFTASTGNFYKAFIPAQTQYQDQLEAVRGEFDKLNTAMPLSRQQFVDLVNSLDLTTDSGRETFAALMGVSDAFAQLTPDLSGAMSNLATMISSQMLGTFEGQNPGAALAQVTADGIYNAIAGGFSQQISAIIVQGVVEPVVMAAMTGSSMSAAVSQASIDAMVAQAQAVANAASQIMNDPAFQSALKDIGAAVGSISIPVVRAAPAVNTYSAAVDRSASATKSAADDINKAINSLIDTLDAAIKNLTGQVDDVAKWGYKQSQQFIQDSLAVARATGALPDEDKLKSAISGINGGLDVTQFATRAEQDFAKLSIAGMLSQIKDIAQGKGSASPTLTAPGAAAPPPVLYAPTSSSNDTQRLQALVLELKAELQRLNALVVEGNRNTKRTADATNGRTDGMPMLVEVVA